MSSITASAEDDEATAAAAAVLNLKCLQTMNAAASSFDWDDFGAADYHIEQYVQGVSDFSSQYGSEYSISYTSSNLVGRPLKFPDYGDFPETYAMRTYGNWWCKAPSYAAEIQAQNLPLVPAHDYVVVYFENFIIPHEVTVLETFNPGGVIRIWAYTLAKTWFCLWETANDFLRRPPFVQCTSRRFSPPLKTMHLPTKTIKIEFNHTHLNYFTEIDGIIISGRNVSISKAQRLLDYMDRQKRTTILSKLQSMHFRPNMQQDYATQLQHFFENDLNQFANDISPVHRLHNMTTTRKQQVELQQQQQQQTPESTAVKSFKDLPFEVVLDIFSYLDLISLFRVGQVSRFCYDVSTHPLLYSEINLKPYWHLANTELLCTLAKRAAVLKKFDLSWCGLFNSISRTEFKKFMQQRGDNLTHLRLNSCKFLNASCIETLGIVCDNLKELCLRNITTDVPLFNFSCLQNLKQLERLDLSQTVIEPELLLTMLEGNRKMKHLNLAFSGVNINMDQIAQCIGTYNQQLISLDMWKSHFLSGSGLAALAKCQQLEEVDLGWCLREVSLGNSLQQLISNCGKLRKLFLAAVRGVTEADLVNIANLCSNLEQLDLTGVLGMPKERYYEILFKCKKLQLLDLSFCDNIDATEISSWARNFHVNIKCSHVSLDLRYLQ